MVVNTESNSSRRGYFVTVEGIEGAGKTTAMNFIAEYFGARKIPLVITREPGGTVVSEAIRQLLLNFYDEAIEKNTELLLMFASRAQHIARIIQPALTRGQWVICDRFTDASYAYQGGGRGIPNDRIELLEQWVNPELYPDFTLLLDIPAEQGLARIQGRKIQDRIEREQQIFFSRVRRAYLQRAEQFKQRFKIIDASQNLLHVQKQLSAALEDILQYYKLSNSV